MRFPLIICSDCDNKLNCFYQFRIDSVRAQHDFANIVKSHFPIHYDENQHNEYYNEMEPIRQIEENMYVNVNMDNIYSSTPAPTTIQSSHDYDHQCSYIEHDLHLALDDDNQTDNQSLVDMSSNQNLYQNVHQPHISPLSPATTPTMEHSSMAPQLVHTPLNSSNMDNNVVTDCYTDEPVGIQYHESTITDNNDCFDTYPQEDNDSFVYDDFDESCQSGPSDRNNVDNAIDKKIEEFIQGNKRGTKSPKICTVCNKLFRTNYKLRVHMETHAENSVKFVCNFEGCTKTFKSKIGLQEHSARHSGEHKFTCEVCSKKFLLRSYFVAHQRIHSSDNQKSFTCSLCSKQFKSKQNLIDHENCHLGLKNFKCDKCDKSFNTKTHHDIHYKSHLQNEQFDCSVCLKFFNTKNYLKTHMKTHYDHLKNYSCGECSKKFIQLSDLKIHYRTHTKEKSFVCET